MLVAATFSAIASLCGWRTPSPNVELTADLLLKQAKRRQLIEEDNIQWKLEGIVIAERAREAWKIRHNARLRAREMMLDKEEVEALRARDLKLYGDPNGPTLEYLIREAEMLGLTGDNVFEWIIRGAQRTNIEVNKRFE